MRLGRIYRSKPFLREDDANNVCYFSLHPVIMWEGVRVIIRCVPSDNRCSERTTPAGADAVVANRF
jgi:hypothetical protein